MDRSAGEGDERGETSRPRTRGGGGGGGLAQIRQRAGARHGEHLGLSPLNGEVEIRGHVPATAT
jgi:hypothetical protein